MRRRSSARGLTGGRPAGAKRNGRGGFKRDLQRGGPHQRTLHVSMNHLSNCGCTSHAGLLGGAEQA
jgi:hypothetical protein